MWVNNRINIICFLFAMSFNANSSTPSGISLSASILGNNWTGQNTTSGTDFEASEGKQFAYSAAYHYGKFFAGLNVQGGTYEFGAKAPDRITTTGSISNSNVKIKRSELDLVAGYFITNRISIFLDIKGTNNNWLDENYEQAFSGFGLGVYTAWPLSDKWSLKGSLGVISNGIVKVNDEEAGEGTSSSLDIGAMYNVSSKGKINFGIKASSQTYKFDSGQEQTHSITGVYVGYSHSFTLN
ncbi:MAG: hypothetical protein OEZ33_08175 [Gammaproteobacteria bacterium]|nr:hypothetical protein [Gammaproteobacteria bacterium]MDH5778173.1 hypothetical protein [Gammaproteobacteria bacterium]